MMYRIFVTKEINKGLNAMDSKEFEEIIRNNKC